MNKDDFRKAFSGSYIGVRPHVIAAHPQNVQIAGLVDMSASWIPCKSPEFVDGQQLFISALLSKDSPAVIRVRLDWEEDLDEKPYVNSKALKVGLVQCRTTAVYVQRYAKRQFNRGYVPNTMASEFVNPLLMSNVNVSQSAGSASVVWGVFNPTYFPFYEAVSLVESGKLAGAAITRLLGVCIEKNRKYLCVTYKDSIVGYFLNGEVFVYEIVSGAQLEYIRKVLPCQVSVLKCS